jgi:Regulator of chromosome condensation (RCC1) repeat
VIARLVVPAATLGAVGTACFTAGLVALASGLAGPIDAAAAAPAAPRTELLSWGLNAWGQLGNGKVPDSDLPVAVKMPAGVRVAQVRGGGNFAVALTFGDGVFAWGSNLSGQLGVGRIKGGVGYIKGSRVPVQVRVTKLTGRGVTTIAVGCVTSYARTSSGRELAWGGGDSGELGNGTFGLAKIPVGVHLPAGDRATVIGAGPASSTAFVIATTS